MSCLLCLGLITTRQANSIDTGSWKISRLDKLLLINMWERVGREITAGWKKSNVTDIKKETIRSCLLEMDPRHQARCKKRDVDKQGQQWKRDRRRLNVKELVLISVCGRREDNKVLTEFWILIGVFYQSLRAISQTVDRITGYRLVHTQAFRLPKKPPVHTGPFYYCWETWDDLNKIVAEFYNRPLDSMFSIRISDENPRREVWLQKMTMLCLSHQSCDLSLRRKGVHKQNVIHRKSDNKDIFLSLSMFPLTFLLLLLRYR